MTIGDSQSSLDAAPNKVLYFYNATEQHTARSGLGYDQNIAAVSALKK